MRSRVFVCWHTLNLRVDAPSSPSSPPLGSPSASALSPTLMKQQNGGAPPPLTDGLPVTN